MKKLTNFRRILHETPPEVKQKIRRQMATLSKHYGIRRRIMHKKYRPKYRCPRTQEGVKYMFEVGVYGRVSYIEG